MTPDQLAALKAAKKQVLSLLGDLPGSSIPLQRLVSLNAAKDPRWPDKVRAAIQSLADDGRLQVTGVTGSEDVVRTG